MAWLTGWAKREAITVGGGTADVTNFTKLVILTADTKRADALATGFDVRFTASDGSTTLFYKREAWTGGGGANVTAIFKVLVASIAQAGGALIYIYWGNAAAGDVSTTTNCWKATAKLSSAMTDITTSTVLDDLGGAMTKRSANNPLQVAGRIGLAQDFELDNADYIRLPNSVVLIPVWNVFTICGWAKPESMESASSVVNRIVTIYRAAGSSYCALGIDGGKAALGYRDTLEGFGTILGTTTLQNGTWYHFGYVRNGSQHRLYLNGVNENSATNVGGNLPAAVNADLGLVNSTPNRAFDGLIDDVRIYSAALTAAEIEYMFGEVNEAGNRCTFGGIEYAFSPAAAFLNLKTRSAA